MVFVLERFPCLRGSFVRPSQFPLFLGWISILTPSFKDTQNVTGVKEYRKRLKKMKERDVTWQPYSLPERTMVLIKYARVPCICFEQISINPADKCYKQLGLKRRDLCELPHRRKMKLIQQSKHKGKNWKNCNDSYKHLNNQWRMRNLWLVNKNYEFLGKLLNDDDDEEKEKVTKENVEGADLGVCNEDEEEDEDENIAEENAEEADIGIGNEEENIAEENVEGVDLEIGESHQNIPSAESPQPAHVYIRKCKRKHTEMTCPDKQRRSTRVVVPSSKISSPYVGGFYGRKASVEVTINSNVSKLNVKKNERKLFIFDMNGILVHVADPTYPCRHKPDKRKKVYMSPNCQDFLEFCLQKFDVAIWSSRTREYLESVVDMFPNLRARWIFCWSQEDCEVISRKGDPGKPTFIKRLEKVWDVHKQYNETNTLLVDDSPCKAICNLANTRIFPPSYDCRITNDNSLGPEGDIRMYLDHLAEAENAKEYVKMNPFGLPPITESHVDWNYYQDLLKKCLKEN